MKQNTTPTLPVKIPVLFDKVERIELMFKRKKSKAYPILLHKVFYKEDIKIPEGDTKEYFILQVPFTAEETMNLPEGEIYMDTLIVLTGGVIPETNIVELNVKETLFEEVYGSDRSNPDGAEDT